MTFLTWSRKVTRLAGRDPPVSLVSQRIVSVHIENLQNPEIKIKVAGLRPRRRPPFCPGQQKDGKKWPFDFSGFSFVLGMIQGALVAAGLAGLVTVAFNHGSWPLLA
ncbi:hypothetical protein [Pelobacter seleniigenes]|uniref:hypothetical protein n=1 Tax=Pelobacter seleniigenes TaxID=407188 RepID=UPI0012B71A5B|nr:hypothetical protein [Pelobacter seleniigenes]